MTSAPLSKHPQLLMSTNQAQDGDLVTHLRKRKQEEEMSQ